MKHRSQKLVAVMMVTAALCADRALAAAPVERVESARPTASFITRLTRNLGRTVQAVKLHRDRSDSERPTPLLVAAPAELPPVHRPVSPFQFRLPPPLI
jgi:hypothetical protein